VPDPSKLSELRASAFAASHSWQMNSGELRNIIATSHDKNPEIEVAFAADRRAIEAHVDIRLMAKISTQLQRLKNSLAR
jgi:hypothetical protein